MLLKKNFTVIDLGIFAASLILSVGVGIFHGVRAARRRQKESASDFLVAGRRLPTVPTALSLLTSFLSGVLLLGVPAEVYDHGKFWLAPRTSFR